MFKPVQRISLSQQAANAPHVPKANLYFSFQLERARGADKEVLSMSRAIHVLRRQEKVDHERVNLRKIILTKNSAGKNGLSKKDSRTSLDGAEIVLLI